MLRRVPPGHQRLAPRAPRRRVAGRGGSTNMQRSASSQILGERSGDDKRLPPLRALGEHQGLLAIGLLALVLLTWELVRDCPEVSPSTGVEALEGDEHGALAPSGRPTIAGP